MTAVDPGDVERRVRAIISEVSRRDVSALATDADLVEHIGVDSLLGLQILAAVEKRFDVRLEDGELVHLRSIARIAGAVARALRTRTPCELV